MTVKSRHTRKGLAGAPQHIARDAAPPKPVGRPKGAPSTIVNVRIPLPLLAQLDRYLDRLEWQTGLKANRGMIARRALELFLASHASTDATGGEA
jgi:hypothetical protein